MLKKIYQELVAIKEELQTIRSSLESKETKGLNIDLLKKGIEDAFIHPNQLTPDSVARQLQPEQNGEKKNYKKGESNEAREMASEKQFTYIPKTEEEKIAKEVIEFLRPKELSIWQVKAVLGKASNLAEWEKLKSQKEATA